MMHWSSETSSLRERLCDFEVGHDPVCDLTEYSLVKIGFVAEKPNTTWNQLSPNDLVKHLMMGTRAVTGGTGLAANPAREGIQDILQSIAQR